MGRSAYDRSETGRGRLSTDASLKLLTTCLIRPVTVRPSETTPRQLLQVLYDLYHPRKPTANHHLAGRSDYGRNRPNQSATRQRQVTAIGAVPPSCSCLPVISPVYVLTLC
nr:hypothetical protein [Escherichia coli]